MTDDEPTDEDRDGGFRQDETDLLPEEEAESLAEKGTEREPEDDEE